MIDRLEYNYVAPLAGAWIEIPCGLSLRRLQNVAPLAGAWIEILFSVVSLIDDISRSPRGSVD